MREDNWQFEPTHKIFLATNHKPEIRDTDNAIWRRVRLIPFNVTIPDAEQDRQLLEKPKDEWTGDTEMGSRRMFEAAARGTWAT